MPKISLLKLLDQAILPTVIVIGSKIGGIFLGSYFFNTTWEFSFQSHLPANLFFLNFSSLADLTKISNFSDMLVIVACGVGFTWVIFKTNFMNQDSVHPKFAARLHRGGKDFLLSSFRSLGHQLSVWYLLSWLVFTTVFGNVLAGSSSSFVLGFALALVVAFSVALYEIVWKSQLLNT